MSQSLVTEAKGEGLGFRVQGSVFRGGLTLLCVFSAGGRGGVLFHLSFSSEDGFLRGQCFGAEDLRAWVSGFGALKGEPAARGEELVVVQARKRRILCVRAA